MVDLDLQIDMSNRLRGVRQLQEVVTVDGTEVSVYGFGQETSIIILVILFLLCLCGIV